MRTSLVVASALCLIGLAAASPVEAQTYGSATLYAGFMPDPQFLNGFSGGPTDASYMGTTAYGSCVGYIAPQPNHMMILTTPFNYLRVSVSSASDTTLVIQGPGGVFCNDDTSGFNPEVAGYFAPGTYQIWVGSYGGGVDSYSISFSEYGAAPAPAPVPQYGTPVPTYPGGSGGGVTLQSGFIPDPQLLSGWSGGSIDATVYGQTAWGPCRGTIDAAPDHTMTLTSSFNFLKVFVQSAGDTTLLIQGPTGTMCNDDTDGVNPQISGAFPPGVYSIWVGAYGGGSESYTIGFSEYH